MIDSEQEEGRWAAKPMTGRRLLIVVPASALGKQKAIAPVDEVFSLRLDRLAFFVFPELAST